MTTTSTELTTALDAVNAMLGTIGQAPISSLDTPGLVDAVTAKSILSEVTRSTLAHGWDFNKDYDYPITPDVSGNIVLPSNILSIDTTREYIDYDVVQRGKRLWDKTNKTFVFDKTLKFDITWLLGYEEIPEPARQFIKIKSCRLFQDRTLGSDTLHAYTKDDEQAAWAMLIRQENVTEDPNIFDSDDMREIAFRRGY